MDWRFTISDWVSGREGRKKHIIREEYHVHDGYLNENGDGYFMMMNIQKISVKRNLVQIRTYHDVVTAW